MAVFFFAFISWGECHFFESFSHIPGVFKYPLPGFKQENTYVLGVGFVEVLYPMVQTDALRLQVCNVHTHDT